MTFTFFTLDEMFLTSIDMWGSALLPRDFGRAVFVELYVEKSVL